MSSVRSKSVVARFDGGCYPRTGAFWLWPRWKSGCVSPSVWRAASTIRAVRTRPSTADMIGFRMKMIAAGYEDGNDANRLRCDPVFKMAQDALPSGRDLASQSTMCRLENCPACASWSPMGRAMVDLYCASFRQVPRRIVLDIDDTLDAVHGGQQLRLFNAHHDYTASSRLLCSMRRPVRRCGPATGEAAERG
ncbi:transposase [Mesorhizobium sp. M0809]|uniref:transposase n=1 Tax=Mesorhizobium sp. M0809 TaxID=2957003 RepID=UPI00333D886E